MLTDWSTRGLRRLMIAAKKLRLGMSTIRSGMGHRGKAAMPDPRQADGMPPRYRRERWLVIALTLGLITLRSGSFVFGSQPHIDSDQARGAHGQAPERAESLSRLLLWPTFHAGCRGVAGGTPLFSCWTVGSCPEAAVAGDQSGGWVVVGGVARAGTRPPPGGCIHCDAALRAGAAPHQPGSCSRRTAGTWSHCSTCCCCGCSATGHSCSARRWPSGF